MKTFVIMLACTSQVVKNRSFISLISSMRILMKLCCKLACVVDSHSTVVKTSLSELSIFIAELQKFIMSKVSQSGMNRALKKDRYKSR